MTYDMYLPDKRAARVEAPRQQTATRFNYPVCAICESRVCPHLERSVILSPREVQVIYYIGNGLSYKEIATIMGIKVGTIKGYVSVGIRNKLHTENLRDIALYAWKHPNLFATLPVIPQTDHSTHRTSSPN